MGTTITLEPESLLAEARERTGLDDFGPGAFREGLSVMLETYAEAGLSRAGRRSTHRRLLELLQNRLRVQRALTAHPEIRARSIHRPVYLTGLPRTGTSALFNLLALDPASRPLLFWEGRFPDPHEGIAAGQEDPRLTAVREGLERMRASNPDFDAIHRVDADGPEECVMLLAHTMGNVQMGIEPLMQPYADWFRAQDLGADYAYYADLLRLLDWQRPGERWLLKSPCHLWALDVLVELFPDACIIQTHRDPREAVGSYCSMMAALMGIRERFDPQVLGPVVLEYLAASLERGLAARDALGPERFIDVDYRRLVDAPVSVVEDIHGHFGLPLPGEALDAMTTHLQHNPRGKHGGHDYTLQQYGLTPEAVSSRLAIYIERFDLG